MSFLFAPVLPCSTASQLSWRSGCNERSHSENLASFTWTQNWVPKWSQPCMEPTRCRAAVNSMESSLTPWLFQLEDGHSVESQRFSTTGGSRGQHQGSGEARDALDGEDGDWTEYELLHGPEVEEEWGQYRQRLRVRKPALLLPSELLQSEGRHMQTRDDAITQLAMENSGVHPVSPGKEGSSPLQVGRVDGAEDLATAASRHRPNSFDSHVADSESQPSAVGFRASREQLYYLESLGVDVVQASMAYPQLLTLSMTELALKVRYFEFRGLRNKQLAKVLSCCPTVLGLDFEAHLKPVVHFLRHEAGVGRADLAKVLYRCPRLVCCHVDRDLRPVLQFIVSLGIQHTGKIIASNPKLLTKSIQHDLLPRMLFFEDLGVPKRDVVTMFRRLPSLFNYSIADNVRPKIDFLVNTMGRNINEAVSFPQYFSCSLERRIKPRHDFFVQHHRTNISLPNLLCSNEAFADRYSGL